MFSKTRRKVLNDAYKNGIVKFVVDPNLEHGTVCQIGENWFYFGGMTAEEENPEEYLKNADIDEVLDSVNSVIDAMYMFEETCDEAAYYDAILENAPEMREVKCVLSHKIQMEGETNEF